MAKDVTRGNLDFLLLGILHRSPGHGYAVISALRAASDGVFDLAEGSVYPALHRLEDIGLLTSDWQPVAGRRRRVYRLTGAGVAALDREQAAWQTLRTAVEAVVRPFARRSVVTP
jgi:PadR family transcriptional regulator